MRNHLTSKAATTQHDKLIKSQSQSNVHFSNRIVFTFHHAFHVSKYKPTNQS